MINLNSRDFSGTNIKSSADKMRAMTIITAKDDTDGLNKLNFSLTFLLQSSAHQDICYVMGQWATEPVRRNPANTSASRRRKRSPDQPRLMRSLRFWDNAAT